MRISVGDKVEVFFTRDVGVVTRFLDQETAIVMIDDDEIPVFIGHLELLVSKNPKKKAPSKKPLNAKELKELKDHTVNQIKEMGLNTHLQNIPDNGIHLALQPYYHPDLTIDYFLIHLINDCGKAIQFTYEMWIKNYRYFDFSKTCASNETLILNDLKYDQLNDSPEFKFTCTYHNKESGQKVKHEKTVRPRAKMLRKDPVYSGKVDGNIYKWELVNQLLPNSKKKTDKAKLEGNAAKKIEDKLLKEEWAPLVAAEKEKNKRTINDTIRVIDLHIEKLLKDYKHLPKKEMLRRQIDHFSKNLEEAIEKEEANMVVIHGVGKGRLKNEIFKVLREYYEVRTFRNDYNPLYGYGATEIFFEYEEEGDDF